MFRMQIPYLIHDSKYFLLVCEFIFLDGIVCSTEVLNFDEVTFFYFFFFCHCAFGVLSKKPL